MNRRNVLRERLDQDKPSIGTHLHTIWPGMVEGTGHSGGVIVGDVVRGNEEHKEDNGDVE